MSTKRPLGSISFNTVDFLTNKLNELLTDELVQSWCFVRHHAEEDTKKDHIHVLVIPSKPVDPLRIRKRFNEFHPDGDLCCLPFMPSKVSDWVLYALHYPPYLIKKGITRQFNYDLSELVSSEPREWIENVFYEAQEELLDNRLAQFLNLCERGDTFGDILASGLVPPNQILFYDKLFRSFPRRSSIPFDDSQSQM